MIQDIAPRRFDITYQNKRPREQDIILAYQKEGVLCAGNGISVRYPTAGELADGFPDLYEEAVYLFGIDEQDFFGISGSMLMESKEFSYLPKERLRYVVPVWKAFAGITGFQIHKWYREHRFCGCCGKPTGRYGKERAVRCTSCGKISYPQICPSVIVAVTDNGRLLMTKYASSHGSYQKYALIAGYSEVGESLEDTVRREVLEEVGLRVKNIRYYKSQPWPFSDALLAGFFCEADGGTDIVLDREELSEAVWVTPDGVPKERSEAGISLTGEMIEVFRQGSLV